MTTDDPLARKATAYEWELIEQRIEEAMDIMATGHNRLRYWRAVQKTKLMLEAQTEQTEPPVQLDLPDQTS